MQLGITPEQFNRALTLHRESRFAHAQQAFEEMLHNAQDNYAEYIQWGMRRTSAATCRPPKRASAMC